MRAVGLVSGGKDSCYNLLQCIAAGHEIVALANLAPDGVDELDSFMYQSVGHTGVDLYAEALDLPLFKRIIKGSSLNIANVDYSPTNGDEVEDLYLLLKEVKDACNIEAVSVGAVLSDYQRVRVENVCSRLGLVSLCYLWQRNQSELLKEMINHDVNAIIIKVAAIGLLPSKHLGKSISEMSPYLHKMKDKYNLNVCGEGGEYETFTLDCALFKKRIVVEEIEVKESSGDVGYINFKSLQLVEKNIDSSKSQLDLINDANIPKPKNYLNDLVLAEEEQQFEDQAKEIINYNNCDLDNSFTESLSSASLVIDDSLLETCNSSNNAPKIPLPISIVTASTGYSWVNSITASSASEAVEKLKNSLEKDEVYLRHVVSVSMYVADMKDYAQLNNEYIRYFGENPPTRACIQVPLDQAKIQLDVVAWRECHVVPVENKDPDMPIYRPQRKTMHVQSISHWAPANIGPYSQAIKVGHVIHVAGMIALVPGTMEMIEGVFELQARLSLRHVSRVIKAISNQSDIRHVVQGVCFVTELDNIPTSRRMMARVTESQIVLYVVVPSLPRNALVEWHTWAHTQNSSFHYEEKGYSICDLNIRVRKRCSHDNSVCAIITTVACVDVNHVTVDVLKEVLEYVLLKLEFSGQEKMCSSITAYYVSEKICTSLISSTFSQVIKSYSNVAVTMVPVLAIEDRATMLSFLATRH